MSTPLLGKMRTFERNLVRLYAQRSHVDYQDGVSWYPNAHRIMCDWSSTYGYSIATCACVTAAISPQCDWGRNLIIADDILAGRPPSVGGALPANVRKAQHIRDDRSGVIAPYFPFGYKVNTFAANLAGNWDVATVDTHALQAAFNDVLITRTLKRAAYDVLSQCYVNAAHHVSLQPALFQSVIWHTWKRIHPRATKIQLRRQWHVVGMEDE